MQGTLDGSWQRGRPKNTWGQHHTVGSHEDGRIAPDYCTPREGEEDCYGSISLVSPTTILVKGWMMMVMIAFPCIQRPPDRCALCTYISSRQSKQTSTRKETTVIGIPHNKLCYDNVLSFSRIFCSVCTFTTKNTKKISESKSMTRKKLESSTDSEDKKLTKVVPPEALTFEEIMPCKRTEHISAKWITYYFKFRGGSHRNHFFQIIGLGGKVVVYDFLKIPYLVPLALLFDITPSSF